MANPVIWQSQTMIGLDRQLGQLVTDHGIDDVLIVLTNIIDQIAVSASIHGDEAETLWHQLADDIRSAAAVSADATEVQS